MKKITKKSGKTVAFQGERGAYSEVAARELLGKSINPIACETFEEVFDKVESKKTEFGIIPIENSLIGSIHRNYDLLLERKLWVVAEVLEKITHCLIAPKNVSLKNVSRVFSHPAALDQCRDFFKKQKTVAPISYYDTAGSVKMLSESGFKNAAAIAGPYAAQIYKMKILKKSLSDEQSNTTRFLLLSRTEKKIKGKAKTSIVFSMKEEAGILFKVLSVFALRDINLTKIESRPLRKKAWQHNFYLDFEGNLHEERIINALDHLREITTFIKIIGTYKTH